MAQQLSRGFGVAIVAVLLHLSLAWRGAGALGLVDFRVAFAGATTLVLCCLAFCLPLAADAGAEASGHQPRSAA
jgi:hypothetical protein